MMDKVHLLLPEVALFVATCVVMVTGLSPRLAVRRLCAPICGAGLIVAGVLAATTSPPTGTTALPNLVPFAKVTVAVVGLLLLLLGAGTVDRVEERLIETGRVRYNPLRTNRAEFYSFFLFSLTGVMLCASADDLIWLFLALELTSLPTYIMVTISTGGARGGRSHEAGVKYFFLGALGAATFLYGFALLYGGTGSTNLGAIRAALAGGEINPIAMAGLLISVIGVAFKIAAVPMHFYTPDVYEGASASVGAFLAFVPKTAGFIAIILLVSTVGWNTGSLPEELRLTLWVMAALTMTVGNVLAILQNNVKRILAYSSIAHSGYMLVGVIAGPAERFTENGLAAVLFYILCYGIMNMGAFAVLACLERPGADGEPTEIETVADLRGLCRTHPALGWTMVLCALSLLGFPPLLGFLGKFGLFSAAISQREYVLVVVLGLNSAVAAFYYLRLVAAPLLDSPDPAVPPAAPTPFFSRSLAAVVCAGAVVILALFANVLMDASARAGRLGPEEDSVTGVGASGPAARVPGR